MHMITAGLKLFAGFCVAAVGAAIVYGYTSGGTALGPLTLGWKGAVGEHLGYTVFVALAAVSLAFAIFTTAFRDAGAVAAEELLGTDVVPVGQQPVSISFWPLLTAFGVGAVVLGLVLNPAVLVAGLVALGVVAFEWMISGWADRATGDPEANKALRDEVMRPVEVPALAVLGVGVFALAFSRVLLAVTHFSAVFVALGVVVVITAIATLFVLRPKVSKNLIAAVVLVCGIGVIAAGIIAAAAGRYESEHGEGHSEEPAVVEEGVEADG